MENKIEKLVTNAENMIICTDNGIIIKGTGLDILSLFHIIARQLIEGTGADEYILKKIIESDESLEEKMTKIDKILKEEK